MQFDPVALRYRQDGLTPDKQREYVEALADAGVARETAARIGVSEQSVARLRRRAGARSFDLACEAARRHSAHRLHSIAWERAIEGTIKGHYYHGELKSEERVCDNRLLIYLLGKTGHLLDEPDEARAVAENWQPWVEALEAGAPPPDLSPPPAPVPTEAEMEERAEALAGEPVWQDEEGFWWTRSPPPARFDGAEQSVPGEDDYQRSLTAAEYEAATAGEERERQARLVREIARRDAYFGFTTSLWLAVPLPCKCGGGIGHAGGYRGGAMTDDLFLQTLYPTTHDLGGFKVHRTLPHRERTTIGPFIFFDQMGPARLAPGTGIDVRPHPHINLATVTYLFAGAIDHRDSLGTFATIEPGAVNLMTAGSGITHSERSPAAVRPEGPELSGIQTWLALPLTKEETAPAFEHVPRADLPVVEGVLAKARVVMGSLWGERAPVTCHSHTIYADIRLHPGGAMPVDAEADERGLYLAEGEAALDGLPLERSTLYVLRPGARFTLRSAAGGRVMLCGGAPLDGPRHVFWNFVSSRRDRIRQAKEDWRAGRFALPPDDHDEFIPLPDAPLTVSYP